MASEASRLKKAREDAGFASAAAAARNKGWNEGTYRHHENGTRGFGSDHAEAYGRAFSVSPAWLLGLKLAATEEVEDRIRTMLRTFDGYSGEEGDLNEQLRALTGHQLVRVITLDAIVRYGDAAMFTAEDANVVVAADVLKEISLIRESDIFALYAPSSDMAPTIRQGALLLIDAGNREPIEHDQIWLFSVGGISAIRRLRFNSEVSAVAVADAPGIVPMPIDLRSSNFVVHGRVAWIGQRT